MDKKSNPNPPDFSDVSKTVRALLGRDLPDTAGPAPKQLSIGHIEGDLFIVGTGLQQKQSIHIERVTGRVFLLQADSIDAAEVIKSS